MASRTRAWPMVVIPEQVAEPAHVKVAARHFAGRVHAVARTGGGIKGATLPLTKNFPTPVLQTGRTATQGAGPACVLRCHFVESVTLAQLAVA
jgi:hypothetical protein